MSARHLFYVVAILAAFIASAQPVEERKANDNAAQQQQQLSTLPSEQPRLVTQMGHSDQITSATFSPEGRFVVTGGWIWDDTARLWDVATGREIRQFRGHSSSVDSVAFSPDGRWVLTGSGDGTARLWDVATGHELRKFEAEDPKAVAFSPDGRWILTGAQLWDVATGQEVRQLDGQKGSVTAVAFSPDGRFALIASSDNVVRLWDLSNDREVRRFDGHTRTVSSAAFSPDGRLLVTGSSDDTARLWDIATGREIRRFEQHVEVPGVPVAFSPDGKLVLTGDDNNTARLWEVASGRQVRIFKYQPEPAFDMLSSAWSAVKVVAFSPNGQSLLTVSFDRTVRLWDVATGQETQRLKGRSEWITAVSFASKEPFLLTGSADNTAAIWDLRRGREVRRLEGGIGTSRRIGGGLMVATPALFSPDGRFVLTGSGDGPAQLWDAETGRKVRRFPAHESGVYPVAFSRDGHLFVTVDWNSIRLWDVGSGLEVGRFEGISWSNLTAVVFSPDGTQLLTADISGVLELWDVSGGRVIREFGISSPDPEDFVYTVIFSPDGQSFVSGTGDNAQLWDIATGRVRQTFKGHTNRVITAAFSADGHYVLTGSQDRTARLWEVASGREVRRFEGHTEAVVAVAFQPESHWVWTGSWDQTARLWDRDTGKELCRLISFRDGTWVVVTPEGRFDTNNLEEIRGLHWIMPDDPLRPLPLEIFMREYYEPRLLPRLLGCEDFPPIPALADLNRVQPQVEIVKVEPQPDSPDQVAVTVEVAGGKGEFQRGGMTRTLETGAYDLRLFRDGQLVGYAPQSGSAFMTGVYEGDGDHAQERQRWRDLSQIPLDPESGKATLTFPNTRLPRRAGLQQVEFSAYAFNVDKVKSATARSTFRLSQAITPRKGRAYLVAVGVNASESRAWDLNYAAKDARELLRVLYERLEQTREYESVIEIPLVSDYTIADGKRQVTDNHATKKRINAVLERLAGKAIASALLEDIPNADQLQPARPEDLVIVAFSSHGYAGERGTFYLFPADIGADPPRVEYRQVRRPSARLCRSDIGADQPQVEYQPRLPRQLLTRAISSDELSLWLRDVDAGDLVLIVDACYAAASVQGSGFKPGPMGSRGLGQVSYDKGMRVLASTQADKVAVEFYLKKQEQEQGEKQGQGLLGYALVHDGIETQRADFRPADGRILVGEWLEYGVERVPRLYKDVRQGQLRTVPAIGTEGPFPETQQPELFDFGRGKRDDVLAIVRP